MTSSKNYHFYAPHLCVIVRHHDLKLNPPSEQKMTSSWPDPPPPPPPPPPLEL